MTQAQHAQQAAELAKAEGHPPHVLVGALLHDIGDLDGHASDGCGDCNDEDIGAKAEGHNNGLELMKYPHL